MRKLKLLIAALALVGGSNVANAQKDVTAQYITNATLSSLDGWKNVNFNTPVRGNNTVGYATECYEGWDKVEKSEYSLTQKITLPKGNYTLVNYSFFREGQNYNTDPSISRAYLKAGSNQVLVKTLGSITAAGYANTQAEGANCFDSKMYRNTLDFTIDADNTEIEIGVYGTFNTEITKSWMILGMFELIDNGQPATMDSPFDVTGYITNPGFEYRDMTGWTLSADGAFGTQNNNQNFKVGGYYAEKWQSANSGALTERSMNQVLTGLSAGYYQLKANMGGNGTYIDLNGKTVRCTTDGDYTVGYVLGENENLTITAGKTAEGTANWIHFDNFKLYFCGDVAAALTTLLGQVSDYRGVIPASAYSALETNVATYKQTYSDVDDLLAAIDAVQTLYDAADVLKTQYATFNALKAKANTLQAVANDNETANGTLANAISTAETDVEDCTTVDAVNTVTSTLKAAMTTYVGAANPVGEGAKFDITFLVVNADVTGLSGTPQGWATQQEGGNFQVTTNAHRAGYTTSYSVEYWSSEAKANGLFSLYNTVNLSKGTYSMSCYAFASPNGVAGATNNAVYFYANDTQGSLIGSTDLEEATLSFVNNEQQDVKIGLKTLAGNQYRWMGIGYVELFKVPSQTFVISEDAEYDTTQEGAGDVTLTRTIKADVWNTIWLPFSMNEADLKAAFGADVAIAEFSEVPNTNVAGQSTINFNTMSTPAISANKPVLLKTSTAGTSYTIAGRTIVAGTPTIEGTNFDFAGTTVASTTVAAGDYFIGSNKLWKSTGATTLAGTRAYLKAKTAGEARLVIDGEETSIDAIDTATVNNGKLYNLNGQEVKNAQKGIFIQNGKKVVLK